MVAQIPLLPEPHPDSLNQTSEEFEISSVQTVAAMNPYALGANQLALEVNEMALNAEAAAGAVANAKWVAGTYAQGAIVWSPMDFMDYRCKVAGVRNTDPALDPTNWAIRIKTSSGGADTTSSAADINLTASSGRLQIISMTAINKKVTFPAAGTLQKGAPVYVIRNSGAYRFSVHKNGGGFICYVLPGQVIAFHCSDITTSAGVWHASGQGVGAIFDGNDPVVLNAVDSRYLAVAMLTATSAVCAYRNNSTTFINAVIVNYGSASGTSKQVNNEASIDISIAAQTATQATVVYRSPTNTVRGMVLDISGTTITEGAIATIDATAGGSGSDVAALTSNKLLCIYRDTGATGTVNQRVLDITSSVITPGAESSTHPSNASGSLYQRVRKVSTTKALVGFRLNNSLEVCLILQTITGSASAAAGGALTVVSPGTNELRIFGMVVMDGNRAVVAQSIDRSRSGLMVSLIDISGSTPVLIANKLINANLTATEVHVNAAKLDGNAVYVSWSGGGSQGVDALIARITSDDRIVIEPINEKVSAGVTSSAGYIACDAIDSTHVMQMSRNSSTYLEAKVLEIAV